MNTIGGPSLIYVRQSAGVSAGCSTDKGHKDPFRIYKWNNSPLDLYTLIGIYAILTLIKHRKEIYLYDSSLTLI